MNGAHLAPLYFRLRGVGWALLQQTYVIGKKGVVAWDIT
jgi:hypothetical protein